MEINQHERPDVFAGSRAIKVLRVLISEAANQRDPEDGHIARSFAILDAAVAFFHADMDKVVYAHPPKEAEPDRTVVWLLLYVHYGTRNSARLGQEFLRNEVILQAEWGDNGCGAECVPQSREHGR